MYSQKQNNWLAFHDGTQKNTHILFQIYFNQHHIMRLSGFLKQHHLISEQYPTIGQWIKDQKVKVNDQITTQNVRFNPYKVKVEILQIGTWNLLQYQNPDQKIIAFCKPRNYLCTHFDPFSRPIVYTLLPKQFQNFRSAGRLDQDSEGLIIFSNDGYFLHSITHPDNKQTKVYLVGLEFPLPSEFFDQARLGNFVITHAKQDTKLIPCAVQAISPKTVQEFKFLRLEKTLIWYEFYLHEGRTNQIRQMCQQFDNPVLRLIRIAHGNYRLSEKLINGQILEIE